MSKAQIAIIGKEDKNILTRVYEIISSEKNMIKNIIETTIPIESFLIHINICTDKINSAWLLALATFLDENMVLCSYEIVAKSDKKNPLLISIKIYKYQTPNHQKKKECRQIKDVCILKNDILYPDNLSPDEKDICEKSNYIMSYCDEKASMNLSIHLNTHKNFLISYSGFEKIDHSLISEFINKMSVHTRVSFVIIGVPFVIQFRFKPKRDRKINYLKISNVQPMKKRKLNSFERIGVFFGLLDNTHS
ncbi:hypothetical protein EON71_00035 [bacterium]|nr:MAG: hypothetical protein EON71_00035 [bacterium]